MSKKFLKCLLEIACTVLLSLYLFVFYELLLVPAILDWSTFGVALTLALTGLLVWCIPKNSRLSTAVLAITFILALTAIDNITGYPPFKKTLATLFLFFLLLIVGKLLGHFSFRRYLTVFLVALALNSTVDLAQARLWTEFVVQWESPALYKRFATVDYFPVKLADVDGDGIKELITEENLAQAEKEKLDVAANGTKYQILKPEKYHFAVYKWNGNTFTELPPDRYSLDKLANSLPVDYLGYPFYETISRLNKADGIEQQITPLLDRAKLVETSTNFAAFPFKMLELNQKSLETLMKGQVAIHEPAPSSIVAEGNLIPGPPKELVTVDDTLKVWEKNPGNKLIATIDNSMISDIGTSEARVGDVDNDKIDELLLTAETSRIMKLSNDGKWQTLWASPTELDEKARFQKFRFEDFAPLGRDKTPQIIALSKSNVRDNPTRYMTGYVYKNGALQQEWRVFSGLINLRAGDVDGDGQNELTGYMYRAQRLFVLKRHHLPVVPALYTITGGLILAGIGLQWRRKTINPNGGVQNA